MTVKKSVYKYASVFAGLTFSFFLIGGCGGPGIRAVNNPRNADGGAGPAAISLSADGSTTIVAGDLASAGGYIALSKTGISTTGVTAITGNIGVSPAAATYLTGFNLIADASNVFSTSSLVTGSVYAANYAVPTPSKLTTAIGSMETAYTDAASRNPPDFNELGTGNIGGLTLAAGLYTWTSTVLIPTDVTISGGANDIWIFQTTGDVTMSAAKNVILAGGAQAKNIYWQVAGKVTIGTTAHFEGVVLAKTEIILQTGASLHGRALSQTMVTLDASTLTLP